MVPRTAKGKGDEFRSHDIYFSRRDEINLLLDLLRPFLDELSSSKKYKKGERGHDTGEKGREKKEEENEYVREKKEAEERERVSEDYKSPFRYVERMPTIQEEEEETEEIPWSQ